MNTIQITDSLSKIFHAEEQPIVFWHDPDQEFMELVPELDLDGVEIITTPGRKSAGTQGPA